MSISNSATISAADDGVAAGSSGALSLVLDDVTDLRVVVPFSDDRWDSLSVLRRGHVRRHRGQRGKVSPVTSLGDLLPLQGLDTKAMQLRHRRETLELRTVLAEHQTALDAILVTVADLEKRLHAIRRTQKEAEDHASLIEDRASAVETSMYDGSVGDPRELESLQVELAQLRANQDDYETRALESMEEADPVETELGEARDRVREVEAEIASVSDQIIVAEAEIDAELDVVATERATVEEGIDASLLSLYESLRGRPGGIAVAEMDGRRCGGCHLEIPSAQAEQIRAATDPNDMMCPECGCLLVT